MLQTLHETRLATCNNELVIFPVKHKRLTAYFDVSKKKGFYKQKSSNNAQQLRSESCVHIQAEHNLSQLLNYETFPE